MKPINLEVTMMKIIGELKAENASLKAEVERLTFDPLTYLDDQGEWMPRHTHLAAVARLQAEVARLKAGEQPTEWRHYRQEDTNK